MAGGINQQALKRLIERIGKFAGPLPMRSKLDRVDADLFQMALRSYALVLSRVFSSGCTGIHCSVKDGDELKRVCHRIGRLRLKYLLRCVDRRWGFLVENETAVTTFINVGKWSLAHGKAENALRDSVSRDGDEQVLHYCEFDAHIEKMSKLQDMIEKTFADCKAKIKHHSWYRNWKVIVPTLLGLVLTGIFLVSKSDLTSSVGAGLVTRLCKNMTRGRDCAPAVSNSFNKAP